MIPDFPDRGDHKEDLTGRAGFSSLLCCCLPNIIFYRFSEKIFNFIL